MAKWCFKLGIDLKRIETIADDESEIIEAVRRMSTNYDFVVTSGGIGPTHDDITYQSIGRAFGLPLTLHEPAFQRMKALSKPHKSQPNFDWNTESPALTAKKRMVELPLDLSREIEDKQVVYVADDLWVPICVVNGNIHILPGVPRLFEKLLDGLTSSIQKRLDPTSASTVRILISTPMAESAVAPYLTELQNKVEEKGVKVGSYPRWGKATNTVTLVGKDKEFLESLVKEVEENVKGHRVLVEGEDDSAGQEAQGSQ